MKDVAFSSNESDMVYISLYFYSFTHLCVLYNHAVIKGATKLKQNIENVKGWQLKKCY